MVEESKVVSISINDQRDKKNKLTDRQDELPVNPFDSSVSIVELFFSSVSLVDTIYGLYSTDELYPFCVPLYVVRSTGICLGFEVRK